MIVREVNMINIGADLRPRQDLTPPLKGKKASLGQSPRNLDGLNVSGSFQYFATISDGAI